MSGVQIVAAPLATMAATGSGYVETQQHTTAAHTGITHEFRIELPATHALFTAFSWADVNTEGNVDASSGETDFTISLDNAAFQAALMGVIESAVGGKAASAFNVQTAASKQAAQSYALPSNLGGASAIAQTILDREIRLEVENQLDANGVLEYLEGDSLGGFSLVLDASGGAADMAEKLNVGGANNTPYLRNLLLQFPNRTDVVGLTDASGSRLPVMAGDGIAFVFSVAPEVTIEERDQSGDAPASNGASTTGVGASSSLDVAGQMVLDNATFLTTDTRKIAFIVDVV